MQYIVNSGEMKRYDASTSEHFHIPSIVLMERAAVAFVEELSGRDMDLSRTLIVCGNGNNGGDGLAIARLLVLAGKQVKVVIPREGRATEQNLLQQRILAAYGVQVITGAVPEYDGCTAVIDALFGVGLSRKPEGVFSAALQAMNAAAGHKIAVDIASGISADDGSVPGEAFRADLTVTFAYAKAGMLLWPGNTYSGEVVVKDIGIDERSWLGQKPKLAALCREDLVRLPARAGHSNKGTFGKVLVAAGSVNMAGAACLCARAAYAAGCGLVQVLTPEENRLIVQSVVPEAVLVTYSAQNPLEEVFAEAVSGADAIVCGPGTGKGEAAAKLLSCVLAQSAVPVLLDADALNLIAERPELFRHPRAALVVTPHIGEMSRLRGLPVAEIQGALQKTAEEFALEYDAVTVLKDERTLTSVPNGQTWLNLSGNCGMATAGSGDVLSGVIASLMAQGLPAGEAAPLGVYLHGLAGDVVLPETGSAGMTAGDLIAGLRRVSAETCGKHGPRSRSDRCDEKGSVRWK